MKVTVYPTDSVVFGNRKYEPNDPMTVTRGEADELIKAGLVSEEVPAGARQEDADEDEPSQKMEPEVENKMEATPKNKGRKAADKAD
jgi:hypothetical protein